MKVSGSESLGQSGPGDVDNDLMLQARPRSLGLVAAA